MADQEDTGFTVVDKRHGTASGDAEAPEAKVESASSSDTDAASESSAEKADSPGMESPPGTEGEAENAADFMPDPATLLVMVGMQMPTRTLVEALLGIFDGHAWRALGLLADPKTGETNPDLPTAQLAIDCVQFLLSKVESNLPDDARREAQRRLTDLRMNYLAKRQEAGS